MRKLLKVKQGTRITKIGGNNIIVLPKQTWAFKVHDNRTVFSSPARTQIMRWFRAYEKDGWKVEWVRKP